MNLLLREIKSCLFILEPLFEVVVELIRQLFWIGCDVVLRLPAERDIRVGLVFLLMRQLYQDFDSSSALMRIDDSL